MIRLTPYFAALAGLFISFGAAAQNSYSILIDSDGAGNGCDVTLTQLATTLPGIDKQLVATVDVNTFQVTQVSLATCQGGSFGPAQVIDGGYPAALNLGLGGSDAIEMAASLAQLQLAPGNPNQIYVTAEHGDTGAQDLLDAGTLVRPNPGSAVPIPTAGVWALLLMGAALLLLGLLFIRRNRVLLGIGLISVAMVAFAANFNADGDLDDWQGESPQSTDPMDDPVPNNPGADIIALFQAFETNFAFFRIDIADLENTPPVADAGTDSTLEDTPVSITLSGSDADSDPLTFSIASAPGNGSLGAITPVNATSATVDYTPDPDFNGADAFTFIVNDGSVDSPAANVDISVTPVNDAPILTIGGDQFAVEDDPAQTVPGFASATAGGGADEAGQSISFNVSNDNNALFSVQPAIDGSGQLSYTPTPNTTGSATVTVSAMDDGGTANGGVDTSADQTFTITVDDMNDAPSFTAGADETVNEDAGAQSVAGWATAISPGPANEAGQTVSFNLSNDNNALFSVQPSVNSAGTLTYTPAADANGMATVTIEAMDDGGTANGGVDTSAAQMFTITVNPVNDAPSFTAGANESVNEDAGAQTVNGWASAISPGPADEAGQTVGFNLSNDNNALFSVQPAVDASGNLSYTPAGDTSGTATVTIEAMDNGGTANGGVDTSAAQMFTITVNDVNDAPSFTAGADETVNEDAGAQSVAGWATAISPGPANEAGQTVSFNLSNDNNALFSAQPAVDSAGTLTYTPAADANGMATVTIEAMDDGGTANGGVDTSAAQMFTITVNAVNDAPSFTAGANESVNEDAGAQTVNGWASAISPGPADEAGQTVGFNLSNDNNALFSAQPAVDASGNLSYTPAGDTSGTATVTIEAMDNGGTANGGVDTSAVQMFTITVNDVNDAPSFTAGADETVNEDAGAQSVAGWATAISPGPANEAGQTVSFNLSNDNNALFSAQPAVDSAGTLTYTPAADANGMATVTIEAMDDGGTANGGVDTSAAQMFTITVNAVNDAPSFTAGANESVNEDAGAQTVNGWASAISPGPADEAGQTVGFNLSNDNNALFSAQPAVDASGNLSYTPAGDTSGTATVTIEAMDNGGTANGGVDTSAAQMFTITVNDVNDAPSFTAGADETVNEDAGAQSVAGWATAISPGPANEAGQTVSFNLSNDNNALFSAQPSVDSAGTLTYTPAAGANGMATVTIEAMDDGGTANGGVDTSPAQMFTITVNAVNDPPVLAAVGNQSVDELVQLSFTATATDPNDTPPDNLTFSLSGEPAGASITAGGMFTWTPTEAQGPGMFMFDVVVTDDGTPNESDSETITVTVNEVNLPPVLTMIGNQMGDELSNIMFTAMATDPDIPAQTLTFSLSGEPTGAMITGGGAFSWTPTEAQGPSMPSFDVIVTDNGVGMLTDSESISIDVAEVNQPPVADDEAYDATGNVGVSVNAAAGLLVGDTDPDLPAQALSATAETVASTNSGSATIAADGSFTYTPPAGFTGMDTFSYTLNDNDPGGNMTDTGTVTVTVADMIWFIDNSVAGPGTGTLADPFAAIATYEASGLPAAGQCIFIEETGNGAYTGPLTLDNNDRLIGNGASGALDAQCGITLAANSASLPSIAGTRPQIDSAGNGINLASGNTIRGLNVGNTANWGIVGGAVGSLAVSDTSIIGSGAAFGVITSGTFGGNVNFDTMQCSTISSPCLRLANVTGTLGVTSGGTGMALNPGSIEQVISIAGGSVSLSYPGAVSESGSPANAVLVAGGHTGTVTLTGNLSSTSGAGVVGNNADGTYNFNGTATMSGQNGISIAGGSAGTFTFTSLASAITNPSNSGIIVSNSAANVSFPGTITKTNNANTAVSVTNNTGTVTLSGAINASTSTANAFVATGGGTINATGTGSTITTTTGIGVNINGTSIGAPGITFRSISSDGGANPGIILNNTGSVPGSFFTVTGDGAASNNGSGGSIINKTGNAIQLTNAQNVTLNQMDIGQAGALSNIDGNGIFATNVNGFTLNRANLRNIADQNAPDEAAVLGIEPRGSWNLTNNLFSRSFDDHLRVTNTGLAGTINVTGNTFEDNHISTMGNDSILYIGNAALSNITWDIKSNSFVNSAGDHIQINLESSASANVTIGGPNMADGNDMSVTAGAGILGSGITFSCGTAMSGTLTYLIQNNDFQDAVAQSLNINLCGTAVAGNRYSGAISDNTLGTVGTADSAGFGMVVTTNGAGTAQASFLSNTLREYDGDHALSVEARDGSNRANVTVNNNSLLVPSGASADAIGIASGIVAGDTTVACLDMNNNTVNVAPEPGGWLADIFFFVQNTGDIIFPGYGGGATDAVAAATYVTGNQSDGPSAVGFVLGSGEVLGTGASCP